LDAVENYGRTALIIAAELGHPSVIELLLDYGANLYARGSAIHPDGGWTPLMWATYRSHAKAVELLHSAAAVRVIK